MRKKVQAQRICWVRVGQFSAKEQNPVSTADMEGSRGWTGLKRSCQQFPQRSQLAPVSPAQLARWQWRGSWRGAWGEMKWGRRRAVNSEQMSGSAFFLQKLLSMWSGSWQSCWCNGAGSAPGALRCGGGKKEQRVNKGWVSVVCWRCCSVLSYLKCSQMCFELSFDISLQLQEENCEDMWSAFVACPEEKMTLLLSAFLDCIELIGFVMWSTGGFACAPVAIGRWVLSCHSCVERSALRSLSCSYRVHG